MRLRLPNRAKIQIRKDPDQGALVVRACCPALRCAVPGSRGWTGKCCCGGLRWNWAEIQIRKP
jgi:hypothetical protein